MAQKNEVAFTVSLWKFNLFQLISTLHITDFMPFIMVTVGIMNYPVSLKDSLLIAAADIVQKTRAIFPKHIIVQNCGLENLCFLASGYLNGICWENPNFENPAGMLWAKNIVSNLVKLEEMRSSTLKEVLTSEFKTSTLYRVKANETESKLGAILNLCHEAREVLRSLHPGQETDEMRITNRFLAEQAEHDESTNRLTARDKKDISPASLQSAHDEDATFRTKGGKSQSGYVANITETCSKDNPMRFSRIK